VKPDTSHTEETLMMKSLKEMNLSKLVAEDIPLFNSLIQDIFPKQGEVAPTSHKELESSIRETISKSNVLADYDPWILKII